MTAEERLEGLFQALWEKVREAGESLSVLRNERDDLRHQLTKAESDAHGLHKELTDQKKLLAEKEDQLRKMQQAAALNEGKIMSNGEKEALVARARELLARIEGYL